MDPSSILPNEIMTMIGEMCEWYVVFAKLVSRDWNAAIIATKTKYCSLMCVDVAAHNCTSVIKWLIVHKYKLNTYLMCWYAAYRGHISVLECSDLLQWRTYIIYIGHAASVNGQVHVLDWLWAKGYGLRTQSWQHTQVAAANGHINVLEWLAGHGVVIDNSYSKNAAMGGHIHVLEWLQCNNKCGWVNDVCSYAIKGGQLETLVWLCKNGAKLSKFITIRADVDTTAERKSLAMMEWLSEHGYIQSGDLRTWMLERDCEIN